MVRCAIRVRFCLAILALASPAACAADAAERERQAEQLEALATTLESVLLPEATGHNGMMANLEIRVARLRRAQENLPTMRSVEPWMVFSLAQDIVYPPTSERFDAILNGLFDEQDTELKELAQTVRTQAAEARGAFAERQKEVYVTLDQGAFVGPEYADVERGIEQILAGIGPLDPEANGKWRPVFDYLAEHLKNQITLATKDADDNLSMAKAMTDAYWNATPSPADVNAAFRRLEAIEDETPRWRDVFFFALGPGMTPTRFLRQHAGAMLDARESRDKEVVRTVQGMDMQEQEQQALLRGIDGCFSIRPSLRRQAAVLRRGRPAYAIQLLIDVAGSYAAAAQWGAGGKAHPPWWGRGDFERADQCYNHLCAYRERWRKDPAAQPLYALVETDRQGKPAWSSGGWLQWRWLDPEDMKDLRDEGRIVTLAGRRWVVPPGVSARDAATIEELLDRGNVKELVPALDLNRLSLADGEQQP